MADRPRTPPPGFDELTAEEQISYVGSLWDRIAAEPEQVPVPPWHRQVIEQRVAQGSLDEAEAWTPVRQRMERQLTKPDE